MRPGRIKPTARPTPGSSADWAVIVTVDGAGVVSHVGSRLLADVADRTTLTAELSQAMAGLRKPRARHDPARVLVDLAVAVADGARTISDIAVLSDQEMLFGPVASYSTCWRLLAALDDTRLAAIAAARARAREVVWAQRAETRGQAFPPARVAGCEFSVGWAITGRERDAIDSIPKRVWADAVDADGGHREGAGLAEITGLFPARALADYPPGTRVIVRRERPHPGAQLDLFEERDGWRYIGHRFVPEGYRGEVIRPRGQPERMPRYSAP